MRWRWPIVLAATLLAGLGIVLTPTATQRADAAVPSVVVSLDQSSDTSAVGETVTLTATVEVDGTAGRGWDVTFTGSGIDLETVVETDSEGVATLDYTFTTTIDEDLTVEFTAAVTTIGCDGGPSDAITHVFTPDSGDGGGVGRPARDEEPPDVSAAAVVAPVNVTVTQETGDGRLGTENTVVATVTVPVSEGPPQPVAGWDVIFREANGRWADSAPVTTDEDGQATFTYRSTAGQGPGTDEVLAVVPIQGCGTVESAAVDHVWWVPRLTVTPATDAPKPAGQSFELVATLTYDLGDGIDRAYVGASLTLTQASSCGQPDFPRTQVTTEDGTAVFYAYRGAPSTDLLTVTEDALVTPARASVSRTWGIPVPPPYTITVSADTAGSRVGTPLDLTIGLTTDFSSSPPTPPDEVALRINGGAPVTVAIDPETGEGTYRYTRRTPGTDSIVASIPYGCSRVSSPVTRHEWWVPTLTVTPADSRSDAGAEAAFVATLSHDGEPLAGELRVRSEATSCGSAPLVIRSLTLVEGRAEFRLRRDLPTVDTITVTEVGEVSVPQQTVTSHTWGAPTPPPIGVELRQSTGSSLIGQSAGLQAIVRVAPAATFLSASGVPVTVYGLNGGPARDAGQTGADGRVGQSYSSDVVRTDTLRAAIPYGCGTVLSPPIEHRWVRPAVEEPDPAPVPPVPPTPGPTVVPDQPTETEPPPPDVTSEPPTSPPPTSEPPTPPPTDEPTTPATIEGGTGTGTPNGELSVTGSGCRAGETVRIELADQPIGTATADGDGSFAAEVVLPDVALGSYELRASCGVITSSTTIDLSRPQADGGAAGAGAATTGGVLIFFVLLGNMLWQFGRSRFGG